MISTLASAPQKRRHVVQQASQRHAQQQGQKHVQRQRLNLSVRMRQSLRILQLRHCQLPRFLAAEAAAHPLLALAETGQKPERLQHLGNASSTDAELAFATTATSGPSLFEHCQTQINLAFPPGRHRLIALALLDCLGPAGWLDPDTNQRMQTAGFTEHEVSAVLDRVQNTMEPTGLFARSLAECLGLQLAAEGLLDGQWQALLDTLPLLQQQGVEAWAEAASCPQKQAVAALAVLRRLDPKPGSAFSIDDGEIFRHDLIMGPADDGGIEVGLNTSAQPRLVICDDDLPDIAESRRLLAEARQQLASIERALEQRRTTLLAVAATIGRHQIGFFEAGRLGMQPLTMTSLAAMMGMHKSTISRTIADKLVLTPQGMIPLAGLLCHAVAIGDGKKIASQAIEAMIEQIIDAAAVDKPLSDAEIANQLEQRGMGIARRTVAKYRKRLGISAAGQRR